MGRCDRPYGIFSSGKDGDVYSGPYLWCCEGYGPPEAANMCEEERRFGIAYYGISVCGKTMGKYIAP